MTQLKITDDLDALLDVLPLDIRHAVERANDSENLLEIILDLGRVPTARFVDREINLRETMSTSAPESLMRITARVSSVHCIVSLPSATGARQSWASPYALDVLCMAQ
jgi:stage III sporulation protein SpoIIIAA